MGGSLVVVPKALRDVLKAVAALPAADAPLDDRLFALDRIAALLPGAVAPFLDAPGALVPAQRALLLVGPRPLRADAAVDALAEGLRRVELDVPAAGEGFSRLLESALSAGDVLVVPRLAAEAIDDDARTAAFALEDAGRELSAIDDLGHALSSSTPIPAGAALAGGVLALCVAVGAAAFTELDALMVRWLVARGARREVSDLFALRASLFALDDDAVTRARATKVERAFALWLLAARLARGMPLDGVDRPQVEALLRAAGLQPVVVFSAATLWQDRDVEA